MPHIGDASPKGIELTITSAGGVDLSAVDTPVSLSVRRPSGTTTWSWTVVGSSSSVATLQHLFAADGSDVPDEGNYAVTGTLYHSSVAICTIETFFVPVTP